jgi:hypothetical protein
MTTELWALVLVGGIALACLWILAGLFMNVLKKLDRCEDKLMAMGEQFPHQAYIEMQRAQLESWKGSYARPAAPAPEPGPWEAQEAS